MYLLNTRTLELHQHLKAIPAYAILSHTWADDEVLFDDIATPLVEHKAGYWKILKSCKQAQEDGLQWIWIDTCCIDKRSSAELSEAINSMYRYYWDAEICYAYLADANYVDDDIPPKAPETWFVDILNFRDSRWFTRGWTLQELLAPAIVEFFGLQWKYFGSKTALADDIEQATRIQKRYIVDREAIKTASVALRFSWASTRETTREEDIAYCLMGLLRVNMPLLYGEGKRAFYRLQLEILRQSQDHTLFAWGPLGKRTQRMPGCPGGVFSTSPKDFDPHIARIPQSTLRGIADQSVHEMTNIGLRISPQCIPMDRGRVIAVLNLHDAHDMFTGIILEKIATERYGRVKRSPLVHVSRKEVESTEATETPAMFILAEDEHDESAKAAPFKFQIEYIDRSDRFRNFISCAIRTPRRTISLRNVDLLAGELISLGSLEQATLIMEEGVTTVLIVFGNNIGQPWLWMVETQSQDDLSYLLRLSEKEMRGAAGWKYNRDFAQLRLFTDDRMWVQVLARKKHDGPQALWTLTVAASEGQMSARQPERALRILIHLPPHRHLRQLGTSLGTPHHLTFSSILHCICESVSYYQDRRSFVAGAYFELVLNRTNL